MEEKLSAVAVLRNSAGIDRDTVRDVEAMLSNVMKQCAAREHKLQQSLQLVSAAFVIISCSSSSSSRLVVWRSSNTLCQINKVALCRAQLVFGWVNVRGQVNRLGTKPAS